MNAGQIRRCDENDKMLLRQLKGNITMTNIEIVTTPKRFKVRIHCKQCRENIVLRGIYNKDGDIETGFKRCFCGNSDVKITRIDG